MDNLMHLQSVERTRRPGLLLLALAVSLIVVGATVAFTAGSMRESNASTLPGPVVNSTELLRDRTERSIQVVPVLDHSVVNREEILAEPDPSSPMSPAYYHI